MNYEKYSLPWHKRFLKSILKLLKKLGSRFVSFFKSLFKGCANIVKKIGEFFKNYFVNFIHSNWVTKVSYFLLGFGHLFRGQTTRGIIYLVLQVLFILCMALFGGKYLGMFFQNFFTGGNIGITETFESDVWDDQLGEYVKVTGDNSFHIILYGILTLFIIVFFLVVYFMQVKESYELEQYKIINKKPDNIKKDISNLLDNKFHLTLLSLPMLGLFVFTIVPLVTMILIAFTNYDANHEVPQHLFQWVGFENFINLFSSKSDLGATFWRVLVWTLIWAVLATFTSYFGGMLLAMLINKKGIKLKKLYRTMFVATIAVPQFVSLLIMSKMLDNQGFIGKMYFDIFGQNLNFGIDITSTRICIVLVNMWIGVPYSMLMCSGILMNIPQELYESARIDGASNIRRFFKITLPYMLFVTGPYLITQFIGNINNFNVIFLLSGGGPGDNLLYTNGAKGTDLLITWLYKLSLGVDRDYKLASVIGILVFIISAVFSLIVYNKSSAVKGEDNFQ